MISDVLMDEMKHYRITLLKFKCKKKGGKKDFFTKLPRHIPWASELNESPTATMSSHTNPLSHCPYLLNRPPQDWPSSLAHSLQQTQTSSTAPPWQDRVGHFSRSQVPHDRAVAVATRERNIIVFIFTADGSSELCCKRYKIIQNDSTRMYARSIQWISRKFRA